MATFWPDGLCRAELADSIRGSTYLTFYNFDIPDDSVCTLPNDVLYLILIRNVEADLPRGRTVSGHLVGISSSYLSK